MRASLRKVHANVAIVATVASAMALLTWQATPAVADAGDGTLTLRVVRDVAGNGTEDAATDFGVASVPFTAADGSGNTVAGTTGSDGSATINLTGLTGGRYRIQAAAPAGSNLQASPTRTGAGALSSLDSYVNVSGGANQTVTMGLWDPTEYCQTNPDLVTCGIAGTTSDGVTATDKTGVARFSSTLSATQPGVSQTEITRSQDQGSVYGLGTDRSGNIFLGTSVKRHSAYGPSGATNTIYRTNAAATNSVTPFVTLPGALPAHSGNLMHDDAIAASVGNAGLGGVTVSGDGKTVYAVNLSNSRLYSIPIVGTGTAVTAGTPTSVAIPRPAANCVGTWHPYGLGHRGMSIYVGGTCGAETTVNATTAPFGDPAQVYAYVYQVGGSVAGGNATFNQIWQHSLNYNRGCAYYTGTDACVPGTASANAGQPGAAHWQAWNNRNPGTFAFDYFQSAPQPILGSIAVTANGSLVVGLKDRFVDLQGNGTYGLNAPDSSDVVTGINAGDILRVCNVGGTYTTENNGSCGGTTGANAGNSQGPAGGEYYNDDWTDGFGFHNQTSEGAVYSYSASTDVWSTRIDPFDGSVFKQGVAQYGVNGTKTGGQEVFASDAGDPTGFGKGAGLASLQALCTSAPVQLGNRVWFDANRNGREDANELPVPGVTVKLLPATGTTALASTTTSATGQYYFSAADGVKANTTYRVQFDYSTADTTTLPDVSTTQLAYTTPKASGIGNRIDSDPSATTGSLAVATITTGDSGVVNHDVDAGLIVNNTIGDFVYYDRNRNGLQDTNDPGIAGIDVHLLDGNGNEVQADTTDADGKYLFTNVPDGTYSVKFDLEPANLPTRYQDFVVSPAGTGGNRAVDSNPSPTTYLAPVTVGANNRTDLSIDAGIQAQDGVIGNFVWKDTNGNGRQDTGEPGIPGVTVQLLNSAGTVIATTVTVNDERGEGFYLFSGLNTDDGGGTATYRVRFSLAANQLPDAVDDYTVSPYQAAAATTTTDSDANPNDTFTSPNVVLSPTVRANLTIDAGLVPPPNSVGDFVWADLNKNGLQDVNEPGIDGVTVRLYNATNDNLVATTTTANNGRYAFTDLADGSYYVIVDRTTLPAAYADNVFTTNGAAGNSVQNDSEVNAAGRSNTVTVGTNARAFDNLDAGLVAPPNTIGDFVWDDRNRNGVQDANEPGISGVTVKLLDGNGDPVLVGGNPVTTTTNGDGAYAFTNIPDGTYQVQVDLTDLPATVADFVPTIANAGGNSTDSDIGVTGISAPVTVGVNNRSNQTVDAGLAAPRGTIGDYVFYDRDRNNVQSTGDTGVPGVTVTLLDGNGDPVDGNGDGTNDTTTTDGTGKYTFTDLAPGTYGVRFGLGDDLPAAVRDWTAVTPNAGGDNATDSDANQSSGRTATVTIGVNTRTNNTLDLGLVPPRNALGNFVWFDRNRNGIQDDGEPGIDGVTVELLNQTGSVIDTTTTAGGGLYQFPDVLPDGQYRVHIVTATLPAPYTDFVLSPANRGTNNAADSDADPTTGITSAVSLGVNNRSNQTLDAGLYAPFDVVGDFVWNDLNRNGVQDADEPGVANVKVDLLDATGAVITSTTTDANGMYLFADLEDGTYAVRVDLPALPSGVADYRPTSQDSPDTTDAKDSDADPTTGRTQNVTLGAGARSNLTLDIGLVAPVNSIGDRVFYDRNRDGLQTTGEPGLEGVTVELLRGTTVVDTTTTGADGSYLFTGLADGTYSVRFRTDNLPTAIADYTITTQGVGTNDAVDSDANPATGQTRTVTLGVGSRSFPTLDAGLISPTNSVGDFVWLDKDRDGQQQSGEPGVPGVTVQLLDATGTVVATDTTDTNGKYLFPGLDDGTYSVRFDVANLPQAVRDYTVTTQSQGNAATDSDADATTGETQQLTLGTGARQNLSLDLGLVQPPNSIGDFVWNDLNGNGVQDANEPGIDGVTVELYNGTTLVATKVTANGGAYTFADIPDGTYTVRFRTDNLPDAYADYKLTTRTAGGDPLTDSNPDPTTGRTATVTVGVNSRTFVAVDAGLVAPVNTLGDYVWFDRNRNGVQNASETGLNGITVELVNAAGTVVDTTLTAGNGAYAFTGFPDGNYTVRFRTDNLPAAYADYALTTQASTAGTTATDSNPDPATGVTPTVTFGVNNRSNQTVDAGFLAPLNQLGDFVWIDTNANGLQDANEPGVEGVTVTLQRGSTVVDTTTTNALGRYTFTDLDDGTYSVRFDVANLPAAVADYTVTTQDAGNNGSDADDSDADPATGRTGTVSLGQGARSNLTLDLGLVKPANTLGDFVWFDRNRNGVQDASETGLNGITVELVNAAGTVVDTQVTSGGGAYAFTGFPDGSYTVRFRTDNLPAAYADYTLTTQASGSNRGTDSNPNATTGVTPTVTFGVGNRSDQTVDAGFVAPVNQLGDFVWIDRNRNGIQDAGEPGVAGVTVQVLRGTTVVATTTTDADGKYLFTDLDDGTYSVRFDVADLPAAVADYTVTTRNAGGNNALDSDANVATGQTAPVALGVGNRVNPTLDLGLVAPPNSIGDYVWFDRNVNGIQDAGEPGIANVTVQLLNAAGDPIDADGDGTPDTAVTDANGKYTFTNLPDGTYRVAIDKSTLTGAYAGYVPTIRDAGTDPTLDSDIDRNTGISGPVTVGTGTRSVPTLDAGFVPSNTISGTVYRDNNKDGTQQSNEPGVPCATVQLINAAGEVVATTRTNSDGTYQFAGVPDGTYTVRIDTSTACGLPTGSTIGGKPGETTTTLPPTTVGPTDPTGTPPAVPVVTPTPVPPTTTPPTTTPPTTTPPTTTPPASTPPASGGSDGGSVNTTPGASTSSGSTASTGVDVVTLLGLAFLLFAGGLVFIATARRRQGGART